MNTEKLKQIVICSLWNKGILVVDRDTFEEMKQQAIAMLPIPYISSVDMAPELKREWKDYAIHQIAFNAKSYYVQTNLPIKVPYVILKGTSTAQYYPYPEYRTMGDIDVMTKREDLDAACQHLIHDGYSIVKELNREITLKKDGIIIELHRRFATLSDPVQAKYLDDLIIENISSSHILPDAINGLVLLQHIDQHMEGGIGLRQIIDWMMFVDKCLSDKEWPQFQILADNIGLKNLAIVTTRMCELYLGLPSREWSADADEALCKELMNYVISCGNFGNKKSSDTDISINAFTYATTLKTTFQLLQKQGLNNWGAAKKHVILRPFAWIYQINRYTLKGLHREKAITKLKAKEGINNGKKMVMPL